MWQCNRLEETGTICSLIYDIPNKRFSTLFGFLKGHWTQTDLAHGDKRNPQDLAQWRELAKAGASQADRVLLSEQAEILNDFRGPGEIEPIKSEWPTL